MAEIVNMRMAYGKALVKLGETHPDVVVLSADVANSDHSYMFGEVYPERFYNVGIAEPALVDMAVGFAYTGKIPFANTFSCFFATRAVEMIRTHCCYGRANVKLMGAYSGLSDSFDGPTHHSITDLAIMRSLPHMTIVVPSDANGVAALLPQVADWDGPVFMRHSRNEAPTLSEGAKPLKIGRAVQIKDGTDLTLVACGVIMDRCLQAATKLEGEGFSVRIVEMHTIKPLDTDAVLESAEETGAIVTVEEHNIIGGLGGAVAETVCEGRPVPVVRVGIRDAFAETGPYDEILDKHGLAVADIIAAAKRAVELKS